MGDCSERIVLLLSEYLVSPKGNGAYNFSKMTKEKKYAMPTAQVEAIRRAHLKERQRLVESISNMSIMQLAKELAEERELKNQAYYFILQGGHLEAFKNYRKSKNQTA